MSPRFGDPDLVAAEAGLELAVRCDPDNEGVVQAGAAGAERLSSASSRSPPRRPEPDLVAVGVELGTEPEGPVRFPGWSRAVRVFAPPGQSSRVRDPARQARSCDPAPTTSSSPRTRITVAAAPSAPARARSGRGVDYRTQGAAPADRRGQQVRVRDHADRTAVAGRAAGPDPATHRRGQHVGGRASPRRPAAAATPVAETASDATPTRKRRPMTAKEKKAVSERMRASWAERRKNAAK